MLPSTRLIVKHNNIKIARKLVTKVNKPISEKQVVKVSQDVVNYIETSKEYSNIVEEIPKILLKKYKTPETMYLINNGTAQEIIKILSKHMNKFAPIVEVNPGFGILTKELLQCQKNPIYLYETSIHFIHILQSIQNKYPDRVTLKHADFFGMWKLAFIDKMDEGNRVQELLGTLATDEHDRILNIIGAMPSLSFVKHLINTIVFHKTISQLGRPDLFIAMPGYHYEFLTDSSIQLSKHKSMPALFQLLFNYRVLAKVPKVHYLPWTYPPSAKKAALMDEYCLYIVNITQKESLPCPPSYLPLLWYFFKPHTFSRSTRVIPMLEQWIPGCGVWLITGQDPPDINKKIAPGKDDEPLPHMNIFTEFGDLSLKQKITVFKRFVSWPEFEQCPFRATMENNLPRYASQINDDDDKTSLGAAHIDDMEHSDSEIDPENI